MTKIRHRIGALSVVLLCLLSAVAQTPVILAGPNGLGGTVIANQGAPGSTPWPVQNAGANTVISGQQAVTASAVALPSNAVRSVCVKASKANTINVYLGPSAVTTSTGIELAPGDATCQLVSNTNVLYVIASATGASVSWLATN